MGRYAQATRHGVERRDLRPFSLTPSLWVYGSDQAYELDWLFGAKEPDQVWVDICGPGGRLPGYPRTVPKTPAALAGNGPLYPAGTTVTVTICPVVGGRLGPGRTAEAVVPEE